MKLFAAAMLGTTMALAGPVMAQDRDSMSRDKPAVEHRMIRHHVTYQRTYKSDQEEHQATEDLNRQYRGVPTSDRR
jgi:hypothetical protein